MTQLPTSSNTPAAANKSSPDKLSQAFDYAQQLYELSSVTGATFLPKQWSEDGYSQLQLTTSHKSLAALTKYSATETVTLNTEAKVIAKSPAASTSEEVKYSILSPDGSRLAKFRVSSGKEGKGEKRVIEIMIGRGERKLEEINVTKQTGDFYFDATFGAPSWHPDNQHLVFTAEAPSPKPSEDPHARPSPDKFRYTPDFGETFTGKVSPTLFLLALSTSPLRSQLDSSTDSSKPRPSLHRLTYAETGGEKVNFGQPVFIPSSSTSTSSPTLKLLATGYSSLGDDRKLGIVYCANRPARVYELTLGMVEDKEEEKSSYRATRVTPISPEDRSSRSPRVCPLSSSSSEISAVYISNTLGGVHSSCASLHLLTLDSASETWSTKDLVSTIYSPKTIDDFPGLYLDQLPSQRAFLSLDSGPHIVFSSIWRSRRVPLLVSLVDGKVTSLAPWPKANEDDVVLPYLTKERELDSFGVFGTDGEGRVVAARSGSTRPPQIVVADLGKGVEGVEWKVVRETEVSDDLKEALSRLSTTILPLPKFLPSEIILVSPISINPAAPASINLPPLIVTAHGGPNSTTTNEWLVSAPSMALAGFRVAFVNYPGSLGFGQDFVDALAPQLGILEVNATLATKHYLNTLSLASGTRRKCVYTGGSHGGWIGAHLTSKFPEEFDACVMRNPVVDLPSMLGATDIPDWTYAEMSLDYSLTSPPGILTPEIFEKLHNASPLAKSEAVTTPTLLLVGKNDRRVPPDQARAWFHALKKNKGRNGEPLVVGALTFEGEGHPITNNVENEWVAFEQGLRFLAKYVDF